MTTTECSVGLWAPAASQISSPLVDVSTETQMVLIKPLAISVLLRRAWQEITHLSQHLPRLPQQKGLQLFHHVFGWKALRVLLRKAAPEAH